MERHARIRGLTLALTVTAAALTQGCAPALVGGAAVGASMIHDRRSSATVLEDQRIEVVARSRVNNDETLAGHSSVAPTSYNRVVLLVGQADSPQVKHRVAETVRAIPEVRRVVDEVTIAPVPDFQQQSNDAYITSQVKLALFDIKLPDFDATRVKVVTELRVVYLMGLVTEEEAAAAVEKARYVKGVERVVKVFEYVQPSA
jgi:osmotically-inducible protein OsmY